jgi:hypothetical protein
MGYGRDESACKILLMRPEGMMPLGRPRCRWEDNIEMLLNKWGRVWIGFLWLRIGVSGLL